MMLGAIPYVSSFIHAASAQEHQSFLSLCGSGYKPSYDEYMRAYWLSVEFVLSVNKPWTFKNYLAYAIGKVFL